MPPWTVVSQRQRTQATWSRTAAFRSSLRHLRLFWLWPPKALSVKLIGQAMPQQSDTLEVTWSDKVWENHLNQQEKWEHDGRVMGHKFSPPTCQLEFSLTILDSRKEKHSENCSTCTLDCGRKLLYQPQPGSFGVYLRLYTPFLPVVSQIMFSIQTAGRIIIELQPNKSRSRIGTLW